MEAEGYECNKLELSCEDAEDDLQEITVGVLYMDDCMDNEDEDEMDNVSLDDFPSKAKKWKKDQVTAYMLFSKEHHSDVIARNPKTDLVKIDRLIGSMWAKLSGDERLAWKKKALDAAGNDSNQVTEHADANTSQDVEATVNILNQVMGRANAYFSHSQGMKATSSDSDLSDKTETVADTGGRSKEDSSEDVYERLRVPQDSTPKLVSLEKKRTKHLQKRKKHQVTAYTLFCKEHHSDVVAQNPRADLVKIDRLIGSMWAKLSEDEKLAWKKKALDAAGTCSNQVTEHADFTEDSSEDIYERLRVPQDSTPKRVSLEKKKKTSPTSGYLLFAKEHRWDVTNKTQHADFGKVANGKRIRMKWRNLSEKQKLVWNRKAAEKGVGHVIADRDTNANLMTEREEVNASQEFKATGCDLNQVTDRAEERGGSHVIVDRNTNANLVTECAEVNASQEFKATDCNLKLVTDRAEERGGSHVIVDIDTNANLVTEHAEVNAGQEFKATDSNLNLVTERAETNASQRLEATHTDSLNQLLERAETYANHVIDTMQSALNQHTEWTEANASQAMEATRSDLSEFPERAETYASQTMETIQSALNQVTERVETYASQRMEANRRDLSQFPERAETCASQAMEATGVDSNLSDQTAAVTDIGIQSKEGLSEFGGPEGSTPTPVSQGDLPKKRKRTRVTGYLLFSQERRKEAISVNTQADFGKISRDIGIMWRKLPSEEKQVWNQKAVEERLVNRAIDMNKHATLKAKCVEVKASQATGNCANQVTKLAEDNASQALGNGANKVTKLEKANGSQATGIGSNKATKLVEANTSHNEGATVKILNQVMELAATDANQALEATGNVLSQVMESADIKESHGQGMEATGADLNLSDQIADVSDTGIQSQEEDEDVFQCGKCKKQFTQLSMFVTHKQTRCTLAAPPFAGSLLVVPVQATGPFLSQVGQLTPGVSLNNNNNVAILSPVQPSFSSLDQSFRSAVDMGSLQPTQQITIATALPDKPSPTKAESNLPEVKSDPEDSTDSKDKTAKDSSETIPQTPFQLFYQANVPNVVKKFPDLDFGTVSEILNIRWSTLPKEEQQAWEKRAAAKHMAAVRAGNDESVT